MGRLLQAAMQGAPGSRRSRSAPAAAPEAPKTGAGGRIKGALAGAIGVVRKRKLLKGKSFGGMFGGK